MRAGARWKGHGRRRGVTCYGGWVVGVVRHTARVKRAQRRVPRAPARVHARVGQLERRRAERRGERRGRRHGGIVRVDSERRARRGGAGRDHRRIG